MKEVPGTAEAAPTEVATSSTEQPAANTVDPKLAAYEKKERQLRAMMKQIQTEKQSWESTRQQQEQEYQTNYIPKNRFSEDPLGALEQAGVTTEKLTELLLNAPNAQDPTIRALKAEIAAIKESQGAAQKYQEQQAQTQYAQAKKQIGNEVKLLIDAKPEDFEGIVEAGLHDEVVDLIERTFNEQGYIMDVEDAALQVENELIEQSLKFAKLKKIQARLNQVAPPGPEAGKPQQPQSTGAKTLTNSMNQAAPEKRRLSEKERRERAIAMIQGKLNT